MKNPSLSSRRWLTAAGSLLLLATLGGCVTKYGAAKITTDPPGAEVVNLGDDSLIGVTPVKLLIGEEAQARKSINIRVQKDGYRDKTTAFWVTLRHNTREEALEQAQDINVKLDQTGAFNDENATR